MNTNIVIPESISKEFLIDFISNSISFETLLVTKDEVIKILDGQTKDIDRKKVTIVLDYLNGILHANKLVEENKDLTENDVKDIHEKIVDGFAIGGLYRNVDISIKGSNHTPPSYIKVYDRMKKYFNEINNPENDMYYNIAFAHLQLCKIHPFLDGNGRVARVVLNYQLIKYGLKPIVINYDEKEKYFNLLEEFKVHKNIDPFIEYIKEKQKMC